MAKPTAARRSSRVKQLARAIWRQNVVPAPARRLVEVAYRTVLERTERRWHPPAGGLARRPVVRLLVPVRGHRPAAVRATVASVRAQSYGEWQLYVVPDSPAALPAGLARRLGTDDPRLVIDRERPSRPGAALDAALAAPGADYVGIVDPGDQLMPHALYRVAELLNDAPGTDVVYTDEQVGGRWGVGPAARIYKPDWSPDYALSEPYVGRLCVYRRALAAAVGGLRADLDGAREYDLLLRLYERGARVGHLPAAVYRRAADDASAAAASARDEAAARAVADHLARVGAGAEIVSAADGASSGAPHRAGRRVRYRVRGTPRVSIVIPTVGTMTRRVGDRTVDLLANTVQSIAEHTEYRHFEIIYVHDRPLSAETLAVLAGLDVPVRGVPYDRPFNWSDKTNVGAAVATGEHLLALNDDIEVIDGDWLSAMVEYSQQDAVGAVGAKLLFPDGSIQHAGVVLSRGSPGHLYYGLPVARQAGVADLEGVRNYSAVTGACLMTRTAVFREVGGFSPAFANNFNDVDYCLKVQARGYRVVFTPYARLYHLESVSRALAGNDWVPSEDLAQLARAWPDACARDPYHDARRRPVPLA